MRFIERRIGGWGRYPQSSAHLYRPESPSQIGDLLRSEQEPNLLARGCGRSYGDAALNQDRGILLTQRVNCFLDFDPETGALSCEAGVTLEEILEIVVPRGWFLPVTPGTKYVSVGGAIACDVHGKNHHVDGGFSSFVQSLDLLMANGEQISCSPASESDLFWATVGGMGLTGVILRACIQLRRIESAFIKVDYFRTSGLDETLEQLEQGDEGYLYSVAWVDCLARNRALGRAVLMRGNHCSGADLSETRAPDPLQLPKKPGLLRVPIDLPGFTLNPLTIRTMNALYLRLHRKGASSAVAHYDPYFYPLDGIADWNRGYGSSGFIQYQLSLPPETAARALRDVLARTAQTGFGSFLVVLKRFGPQAGILSFPFEGYTLTLDIRVQKGLWGFLNELDQLVLKEGGRVYLAKDARLSPETFRQMYPAFREWLKIKKEVDPGNRFTSDLSRRLRLSEDH